MDRDVLAERVRTNVPLLNAEQKNVYDSLMMERKEFTFSMLLVGQAKRSSFR